MVWNHTGKGFAQNKVALDIDDDGAFWHVCLTLVAFGAIFLGGLQEMDIWNREPQLNVLHGIFKMDYVLTGGPPCSGLSFSAMVSGGKGPASFQGMGK